MNVITTLKPAIEVAISRYRKPGRPFSERRMPCPPDMQEPIKIVAGDTETLRTVSINYGVSEHQIKEACELFLQEWISQNNVSHRDILGLTENATVQDFKLHKRGLLKWLHPDRNPSKWQQKLFYRISELREEDVLVPTQILTLTSNPSRKHKRDRGRSTRASWQIVESRKKHVDRKVLKWRVIRAICYGILLIVLSALIFRYFADFAQKNFPYFQ